MEKDETYEELVEEEAGPHSLCGQGPMGGFPGVEGCLRPATPIPTSTPGNPMVPPKPR